MGLSIGPDAESFLADLPSIVGAIPRIVKLPTIAAALACPETWTNVTSAALHMWFHRSKNANGAEVAINQK